MPDERPRPQGPEDVAALALIESDGVVTLKAPAPGDSARIVSERDEEARTWLGPGATDPSPVACIWVADRLVGWVDYDRDADHDWLGPGEVNVGYSLFPAARGNGYASRAVELLLAHLARETGHATATLLIHPDHARSLALARRLGFAQHGEVDGQPFFRRELR